MFDFEEDLHITVKRKHQDDYDVELGIALSLSIMKTPVSRILSPEEVQHRVFAKTKEVIKNQIHVYSVGMNPRI